MDHRLETTSLELKGCCRKHSLAVLLSPSAKKNTGYRGGGEGIQRAGGENTSHFVPRRARRVFAEDLHLFSQVSVVLHGSGSSAAEAASFLRDMEQLL